MKYCPYCGKGVQANDRFCLECGSALDVGQHDETSANNEVPETGEHLTPGGKNCSGCGLPVDEDDAFFQECGAALYELKSGENIESVAGQEQNHSDADPMFCGQCDASMLKDDLFCPDCGAVVNGDNNTSKETYASASVGINSTFDDNEPDPADDNGKRKLSIWIIVIPLVLLASAAACYFLVGFGNNTDKALSESAYVGQRNALTSADDTAQAFDAEEASQTAAQNNAATDQTAADQEAAASFQQTKNVAIASAPTKLLKATMVHQLSRSRNQQQAHPHHQRPSRSRVLQKLRPPPQRQRQW